jgi:hypothetical protein
MFTRCPQNLSSKDQSLNVSQREALKPGFTHEESDQTPLHRCSSKGLAQIHPLKTFLKLQELKIQTKIEGKGKEEEKLNRFKHKNLATKLSRMIALFLF